MCSYDLGCLYRNTSHIELSPFCWCSAQVNQLACLHIGWHSAESLFSKLELLLVPCLLQAGVCIGLFLLEEEGHFLMEEGHFANAYNSTRFNYSYFTFEYFTAQQFDFDTLSCNQGNRGYPFSESGTNLQLSWFSALYIGQYILIELFPGATPFALPSYFMNDGRWSWTSIHGGELQALFNFPGLGYTVRSPPPASNHDYA